MSSDTLILLGFFAVMGLFWLLGKMWIDKKDPAKKEREAYYDKLDAEAQVTIQRSGTRNFSFTEQPKRTFSTFISAAYPLVLAIVLIVYQVQVAPFDLPICGGALVIGALWSLYNANLYLRSTTVEINPQSLTLRRDWWKIHHVKTLEWNRIKHIQAYMKDHYQNFTYTHSEFIIRVNKVAGGITELEMAIGKTNAGEIIAALNNYTAVDMQT